MRVIITGATSMIGSALVRLCVERGDQVLAVVRPKTKKKKYLPLSTLLRVVECDISNLSWDMLPITPGDVFYHLAWDGADAKRRGDASVQLPNITGCYSAVKLAMAFGCRRFVGAGSHAEYGRVRGVITEDMPTCPETAYGVAKFAAGRLMAMYSRQMGLDFNWARIFSVYGPGDRPDTLVSQCVRSLLNGSPPRLTPCGQRWDYLSSRDAARALYLIGTKGIPGETYNVSGGAARPLREYVEIMRDMIDPSVEPDFGAIPYRPAQVMHLEGDISKLRRDTGFSPEDSFGEGILRVIKDIKGERQ